MSTLLNFIKALPSEAEREAFAKRCDTTLGHLKNVAYAYRPCSTELAVAIERETKQAVLREVLCPDSWRDRWPELIERKRAPGVAAVVESPDAA